MVSIFPLDGALGRGTPARRALRHVGHARRRCSGDAVSGPKQGIGDLDADRCRSVPLLRSAGLDVVVLEARDRLGGRTVKREISGTGGEVIDMGWPVDRTDPTSGGQPRRRAVSIYMAHMAQASIPSSSMER
jgi:hypothetical protein